MAYIFGTDLFETRKTVQQVQMLNIQLVTLFSVKTYSYAYTCHMLLKWAIPVFPISLYVECSKQGYKK